MVIRVSKKDIIMRSYTNYSESEILKQYRVFKSSGIYNYCFSANRSNYNLVIIESDWKRIDKEVIRL